MLKSFFLCCVFHQQLLISFVLCIFKLFFLLVCRWLFLFFSCRCCCCLFFLPFFSCVSLFVYPISCLRFLSLLLLFARRSFFLFFIPLFSSIFWLRFSIFQPIFFCHFFNLNYFHFTKHVTREIFLGILLYQEFPFSFS